MRPTLRSGLWLLALCFTLCAAAPLHAQEVNGDWVFQLTASEGSDHFTMKLAVDGETVSGAIGENETFEGSFKDGQLKLTGQHYVEQAGYAAPLVMSGTVDGDQIRGTASWDSFAATMEGHRPSS